VEALALGESCFIGVATEEGFGQGWKIKGLFFGGNLSDGGGLVRQRFGEWIKQGMKIGVLVEYDSEAITVTFYQDGRCLGPAFKAKRLSSGEVFPVVKANRDGDRFAISFPEAPPAARAREPPGGGQAHPAEGTWALERLSVGPELGEFPLAARMEGHGPARLTVEAAEPGTFRLCFRVANSLSTRVACEQDPALAPFEKLKPGPVASTRMMGPEGMMQVEAAVAEGLEGLGKWLCRDGGLCEQRPWPRP